MFNPADFFHFLRKPHYHFPERKKTNILFTALKIYLLSLLILGLINSLSIILLQTFMTLPADETLIVPESMKEHLWSYVFLVVIFSPIMEEIIFRLSLLFDPVYFSLSISTLIALIIHKVSNGPLSIISFLLLFFIIFRVALIYKSSFSSFWDKNFKYIFYFLAILFGLVHISNYNFVELSQYSIAPILIFPQLALGLILSFTRLFYEKGFLICIIIHVLMNLVSVSISLLQYFH